MPPYPNTCFYRQTTAGPGFLLLMLSHAQGLRDHLIESQRGEGVVTQTAGDKGVQQQGELGANP